MATKARQQYFADEISLQKDSREFSIEDSIKQKIDSVEAGAQVNTIETVKVNGTALTPDANKAVDVEVPEVIDNLYTTSTDDALSAKQGKVLYDYIQNIASRGRFLSNWNSATGLPMTNPSESPYPYKSGDYFVVSNVAGLGGTNYRPDGSSYIIGQASTVAETDSVDVSDFYFYDGTNWLLLKNSARSGAVDSSLSTSSTNPVENRVVTNALNGKHPGEISNTAPASPVEGMLWYDTVNDELKTYDGTAWTTEGTKMVVLEYGVSTWQNFIDAYNENAIVYCKVSSGSSGYRMAFMAYTAGQGTPTEVEFQYYRSRSSHSQSSTQLDEVYVYKLTNAGVWTTTQRDTGAGMIAGTGIGITFNSSGATINNNGVTSVNSQTGAVTLSIPTNVSDLNNDSGFITGITSGDVTTALGYTPYDASNPSGYITSSDIPTDVSDFNNDAGYLTSSTGVTSVNGNNGAVTVNEVPSGGTNGDVLTNVSGTPTWQAPTGGTDIEYKTQAEYNALLPGALTDNKHYFIYISDSPTPTPWQPGANTLLYYTFDGDVLDHSGNNNDGTFNYQNGGAAAYATGLKGYQCADFSRSNKNWVTSPFSTSPTTVSFLMKWKDLEATSEDWRQIITMSTDIVSDPRCFRAYPTNYQSAQIIGNWILCTSGGAGEQVYTSVIDTNRHHFCVTTDGTNTYVYIDKTLVITKIGTLNATDTLSIARLKQGGGQGLNAYMQNLIIESVQWTVQDISNYYNEWFE